MGTPYLSEIRIMSFGFAPKGWAQCNGQLLPISQNQGLFSLLGTTYGGDGRTTFGLPNLASRTPLHRDNAHPIGAQGGEQSHTLNIGELPIHTHMAVASATAGDSPIPTNNYLGAADNFYAPLANPTSLPPGTVGVVGGGQAHNNLQPYLVLNFCIALQGVFPTQN